MSRHADPADSTDYLASATAASTGVEHEIVRKFGPYGVTAILAGRGKFAKVYIAYDTRTGKKVAARVANLEDEDVSEEVKVLRKLHKNFPNPYVVECLQKCDNGKHFVMFMEFCEGGSLEDILKERGTLPIHLCKRYFKHIATALYCMNTLKVVHRDLKPANVMLTSKDLETAEVRLIDFGFVKQANMMHSVKGSPAYMAPERIMKESYGFGAEIYAAGIILFEMVYGFQPFAAATSVMALYHAQEAFQLPPTPQLSPDLADLLLRCLMVDPAARPSIAAVLSHPFLADADDASPIRRDPLPHSHPSVDTVSSASPIGSSPPGDALLGSSSPTTTEPTSSSPATPASQQPTSLPGASAFLTPQPHVPPLPLARPPLGPPSIHPATPMVRRATAPPTPHMEPAAPMGSSMADGSSARLKHSMLVGPGLEHERLVTALLEGAGGVLSIACDSTLDPGERIVMAAYSVELADRSAVMILESQVAPGLPSHRTTTTSVGANIGHEGGFNHSFTSMRPQNSSIALNTIATVNVIKQRSKAIVREALLDVQEADSTAASAQAILVAYVRRALLSAARQELLKEPHCAFGAVLDVYSRCDVVLGALEVDPGFESHHSISKLRSALADRIVAAHSSMGAFATFSTGDLTSHHHSPS